MWRASLIYTHDKLVKRASSLRNQATCTYYFLGDVSLSQLNLRYVRLCRIA